MAEDSGSSNNSSSPAPSSSSSSSSSDSSSPAPSSNSSSGSSKTSSSSDTKFSITNPLTGKSLYNFGSKSADKAPSTDGASTGKDKKSGFFSNIKSGLTDMVKTGKNPFVRAEPTSAAPATTEASNTPAAPATTESSAPQPAPATDSGFDMNAFMNALKNPEPAQEQKPPEPIQGTVSIVTPPDEQPSTTNEPGQETQETTNTEQPAEENTEGEAAPVPEKQKESIKSAIEGLLKKIPEKVQNLLTSTLGLAQGVGSDFMNKLTENMSKASTRNSTNRSNNTNTKTLTFLFLYENGANVIENQDTPNVPTPPFNVSIGGQTITLSNDGTARDNGAQPTIALPNVSPLTLKIVMCMYNNELYAQYVSSPTTGGRKTRNRRKKHNKNKSGVHKPSRERQRRTIKKRIKYKCNKKTYKIDIIIQLPE